MKRSEAKGLHSAELKQLLLLKMFTFSASAHSTKAQPPTSPSHRDIVMIFALAAERAGATLARPLKGSKFPPSLRGRLRCHCLSRLGVTKFNYLTRWEHKRAPSLFCGNV